MSRMQWQDWASLILGLWLIAAPWVVGFSGNEAATWNGVLLGAAVIVLTLVDAFRPDPWPERVSLLVGLWTAISPMVLGFTGDKAAAASTAITGVLIVLLEAGAAWMARTPRATT
jgi:hypothetical protein